MSFPGDTFETFFEGNQINDQEINNKDKTVEDDPVQMAIARHLGVDLTPKGRAARKRLGLSVIVTGSPKSGKSELARQVVKHYGAALINIDAVIEEAILNSETKGRAAQKAYELCKEETNRKMSEMNALESSDGQVHGVSDSKDDKTGSNVNSQPSSKETPATKGSGRNTNAKSTASNTNAKGQKDGYRASPLLPQPGIHALEPALEPISHTIRTVRGPNGAWIPDQSNKLEDIELDQHQHQIQEIALNHYSVASYQRI